MTPRIFLLFIFSLIAFKASAQSPSFQTYVNPVIPGDHPDPTLTKIGDYFYTSGSSFNPTPRIYRSTDLVHWETIAQPVKASWISYGDGPGDGVWGGHMVYHHGKYWHYFGRGGGGGIGMHFVTADQPEGPWSDPVLLQGGAGIPPFGVDNSLFIDDETGKWYLLTKAGESNNHIVELGEDGQPTGEVLDLSWLNPEEEGLPYGWAEGPVMWKYDGFYYYSFAQHLVGQQYVMRSDTLTDNPDDWEIKAGTIFTGPAGTYNRPNHISPAVLLDDSTSWVIGHSYHQSAAWQAYGRQGLLLEVTYEDGWPVIQFPPSGATNAPNLPNTDNIPWTVAKSDMFNESELSPNWSVLGFMPDDKINTTERPGWLKLEDNRGYNTVIQNESEHQYSIITRIDFDPNNENETAGLWILNGPENLFVKVYSSENAEGEDVLGFSFNETVFEVPNTIGNVVWLKLARDQHAAFGYFSADGKSWTQIGEAINIAAIDRHQNDFNDFTGNRQGLFVDEEEAFFDVYIYKDAYSEIKGRSPANFNGVQPSGSSGYLGGVSNNDWALYPGIQFGTPAPSNDGVDYQRIARQVDIEASSNGDNRSIEVWLDAIETGTKIAEVQIKNTESYSNYVTFSSVLTQEVTGSHDVYLRFLGEEDNHNLFRFRTLKFSDEITTSNEDLGNTEVPKTITLDQNYPNPFNPSTVISYQLPVISNVNLKVFDVLGREVATLVNERVPAGSHDVTFNASYLSSGIYIYQLQTNNGIQTKRMVLVK